MVSLESWVFSGFTRGLEGQVRIITRADRLPQATEKRVEGRTIE